MKYYGNVLLAVSLFALSACSSSRYSSEPYDANYRTPDTSLFNNGYTDYHHYHGFDVFRGNASFRNRGFF